MEAIGNRAYFNSLNGGTNVPPLSGFVPPLKCVPPPILCGGLSLNLTGFFIFLVTFNRLKSLVLGFAWTEDRGVEYPLVSNILNLVEIRF